MPISADIFCRDTGHTAYSLDASAPDCSPIAKELPNLLPAKELSIELPCYQIWIFNAASPALSSQVWSKSFSHVAENSASLLTSFFLLFSRNASEVNKRFNDPAHPGM